MQNMLPNLKKLLLFGRNSWCRLELASNLIDAKSHPNGSIGRVGVLGLEIALWGYQEILTYSIPETLLSVPSMLPRHFVNTFMVIICVDWDEKNHLQEHLRIVRENFPVGPIAVVFYTDVELPAYDASVLISERFLIEQYRVSYTWFIVKGIIPQFMAGLRDAVRYEITSREPYLSFSRSEYTPNR